jgi:hypothetical protein
MTINAAPQKPLCRRLDALARSLDAAAAKIEAMAVALSAEVFDAGPRRDGAALQMKPAPEQAAPIEADRLLRFALGYFRELGSDFAEAFGSYRRILVTA